LDDIVLRHAMVKVAAPIGNDAQSTQDKSGAVLDKLSSNAPPLTVQNSIPVGPQNFETVIEDLGNGVILELVQLPAGGFLMGSSDDNSQGGDREKPQHFVNIKAFAIGKYPITQAQYSMIIGQNSSKFSATPNNPVTLITKHDAQNFCQKLSQGTGKKYRLPSEAEWEYACRAGTTTRYYFGNDGGQLGNYAWFRDNSNAQTHPVGEKKPNPWGLYDLYGNVWEWCEDRWHDNYKGAPTEGIAWIKRGDAFASPLRGGCWKFDSGYCRSFSRTRYDPGRRRDDTGFRVVVSL
jgi:formylglycine-generating enzyme required for sulfatase activity